MIYVPYRPYIHMRLRPLKFSLRHMQLPPDNLKIL